jgi:hypothetical protein
MPPKVRSGDQVKVLVQIQNRKAIYTDGSGETTVNLNPGKVLTAATDEVGGNIPQAETEDPKGTQVQVLVSLWEGEWEKV